MLSVSHWWETRTGSPAPGPVTSTRASPPMTVPELGPTGSVPWSRRPPRHRHRRRSPIGDGWRSATATPMASAPVGCRVGTARLRWRAAVGRAVAGTVMVMTVSMVALPATRSVSALARAPSMPEQTPS